MLHSGKFIFNSIPKNLFRCAYFDIQQNAKIVINGSSAFDVVCLPFHKLDKNCVHIPDDSNFNVIDNAISQNSDELSTSVSKIEIPVHRDLDITQHSTSSLNFAKYEGYKVFIQSNGPVNLQKLKIMDLSIRGCADINAVGYIEGNFSATTTASMNLDNLTCENIDLLFGGTTCKVKSAYCKSMTLKSINPETPSDGVTPVEQIHRHVNFGTLHGNVNIEIDGTAELNIGSFEGTMNLRQRLGNVSLHIAGPCPLLEIDVAEGNIEISLPINSVLSSVAGILDITATSIELEKETIPVNFLDNWDIDDGPGVQHFCGNFGTKSLEDEPLWRIHTLRGHVKVTGSSWAEAMMKNLRY